MNAREVQRLASEYLRPLNQRLALSHESKDKIRDVLSSILQSAIANELLTKNPMENVKMPPKKRGTKRSQPYVTPPQFEALVNLIAEPYATNDLRRSIHRPACQ